MGEFNFAQCLINQGAYSTDELQELMRQAEENGAALARLVTDDVEIDARPVYTAVQRAVGDGLADELELYADYMEFFIDSMHNFMHTEGVVSPVSVEESLDGESFASSQRIGGDISLVAGVVAAEPVYLELARRYSEEDLEEIDEMAVDSIEEFLNVINGIYTVDLAKRRSEAELELPRSGEGVTPHGSHQLRLRVYTAFGSFQVVLASDDFI